MTTGPVASILETIGQTPIIRLTRFGRATRTPLYAKLELANPGRSIKDRIGLAIIEAAEREGSLRPGGTIVEATGGNTGVALAMAAAIKGYRCVFVMPDKMSVEKIRLLEAYGAEVVITPTAVPPTDPQHYMMRARQIAADTPNAIFANQFFNAANPEAHYAGTGAEIWAQVGDRITHFVAAAGTGGTVSGVGRYLKERKSTVRVIAPDPVGSLYAEYHRTGVLPTETAPYQVEGIGGDKLPSTLWWDVIDEFRSVTDPEAMEAARRLAREEGILAGGSTGANLHVALAVAMELDDPTAAVVSVVCDTGERYLSKWADLGR